MVGTTNRNNYHSLIIDIFTRFCINCCYFNGQVDDEALPTTVMRNVVGSNPITFRQNFSPCTESSRHHILSISSTCRFQYNRIPAIRGRVGDESVYMRYNYSSCGHHTINP